MREVKVKTAELLEKVKANREKHIKEYEEAVAGYKEAATEAVEKAMAKLKKQIEDLQEGEVLHLAAVVFDLEVPQNHEKDYDQVILMLEMSVDEELSIKADEFACYVMDDWDWKADFLKMSDTYKNKRW
jgi:hypothetical protein